MERTYEVIAVHPGTGEVTRFMIAASSAHEARERAEACGLAHVVVHGPGGGGASEMTAPGLA
ncbi:MAG: hypothetical protein IT437_08225 [Phycisphaerales bacterium]|nr:hypothetical protein [Phycisphaerales bacterium]